jgi:alpha-L-fucosidase
MPNYLTVKATAFSVMAETEETLDHERFLPVECDFRMRRENWFYSDSDEHTVKTLDELIGIYYYSIGRGANLLINIGPGRDGLLPKKDSERLAELGNFIKETFENPVSSDFIKNNSSYIIELKEPALIDHCVIKEDIEMLEGVEQFIIKAYPYSYGPPVTVYFGKTIGHKAVCRFPSFFTKKAEVIIEKSRYPEKISEILLYEAK